MAKKITAAAALLVIGLMGVWVYMWANSPAQTSLSNSNAQERVQGSQITLLPYAGQSFNTVLPSTLKIKTSSESRKSAITAQYLFVNTDTHFSDQVGITIGTMQSANIEEVSAVKLRQTQRDVYEPATYDFMPANSVAFHKKDSFETSIIWAEGSQYATVVVSGSVLRQAELEEIARVVVTNWQWR